MKTARIVFLMICSALLSGCVAAVVNSSTLAVKGHSRGELTEKANAGDVGAQFKLGKSFCCMGVGFDTQTATHWLCKAARQGHGGAMYELGRIYLGDVSRTPAPGQKILRSISAKKSNPHAYFWLTQAEQLDHANAKHLVIDVKKQMTQDELFLAEQFARNPSETDCEYNSVFKD